MNKMKRFLGLVWMLLGSVAFFVLMYSAISNIDTAGAKDINNPLPWIIILVVFAPIAIGLTIFGWYAWKGEYEREER